MLIFSEGKCISYTGDEKYPTTGQNHSIIIAAFEESRKVTSPLFSSASSVEIESVGAKYENFYNFDRLRINRPEANFTDNRSIVKTEVFISQRHIAVYSQDKLLRQALSMYISSERSDCSNAELLKELFNYIFLGDTVLAHKIEDSLVSLEVEVTENNTSSGNIIERLLDIRKRLLVYSRYYSAMFDLLEDLEENLNSLFTKEEIKHFRIHTNKADRLNAEINHLQEYATQVREAYQSQLDIQQNKVMQFFTVVTSIFLPLTLIVGWYGMNLQMPEVNSTLAYPIVIVISFAIVGALLTYFREKQWF